MTTVQIPECEVIALDNHRGAEPKLRVVRSRGCMCSFTSDEKTRTVTCPRCGKVWDAFDAMMFLARDWTNYDANRQALKREVSDLVALKDRLRQDVQNLKAQAKRRGGA